MPPPNILSKPLADGARMCVSRIWEATPRGVSVSCLPRWEEGVMANSVNEENCRTTTTLGRRAQWYNSARVKNQLSSLSSRRGLTHSSMMHRPPLLGPPMVCQEGSVTHDVCDRVIQK
eukprot:3130137-Amphidinium_carterae.1